MDVRILYYGSRHSPSENGVCKQMANKSRLTTRQQQVYDFLRDTNVTKRQQSTVTTHTEELLAKLEKHRISHGDLKHSNILVTDTGLVLTDLDAMKAHKLGWIFRLYRKKDHARFTKFLPKK